VRWGLVGASDIAANSIIPGIRAQPGSRVVAVHSRSPERGSEYARQHGIDRSHDTLAALLTDPEIDAVYISTTNDRHAAEAVAAAQAGRHVLCEKPLAVTLDDARAMVEAASRAGVVLATNHGRRNDPALGAARDIVRAGTLGTPLAARTCTATLLPEHLRRWRLGGDPGAGVALDLLVHDADSLRFLLDDEIAAVEATADDTESLMAGALTTARGLIASFLCSFRTPHGGSSLEVFGDQASLRALREPGTLSQLVLRTPSGDEPVPLPEAPPVGVATVAAFEAATRGEGRPTATGEDGVASLAVALAARDSASSGERRPVDAAQGRPGG
jgi:1,5-anhydro-D-fructose reductase (1,5-anhydro-D-mannitol-forming)